MKRNYLVGASLLTLSLFATSAQAILTVVPNHLSGTEGNSSSSSLSQTGAATLQAFFSQDFLAASGITAGSNISGLAFRRNTGGVTGPAGDTTYAGFDIYMSQSFATPGELGTTFASNIVGAQSQVRSGALTLAMNSMPGGGTPNAFGPLVNFDSSYTYNGGSLLVEIRRGARSGDLTTYNTDTDNTAASQVGARWFFNTSSATATTGTSVGGAQVFQLQYEAVPEPATMVALSLGAVALLRRRAKK